MAEIELPPDAEMSWLSAEQSNSSLIVGDVAMLKMFRRVTAGPHPEAEMGRYLTEQGFANIAPLLGEMVRVDPDGERHALAIAQGFIRNQGDAWTWTLDLLMRGLSRSDAATARRRSARLSSTRTTMPSPRCSAGALARCTRSWREPSTIRRSRRRSADADDAAQWRTQAERQLDGCVRRVGMQQTEWDEAARRTCRGRWLAARSADRRSAVDSRRPATVRR